jgi:hypothetical protein
MIHGPQPVPRIDLELAYSQLVAVPRENRDGTDPVLVFSAAAKTQLGAISIHQTQLAVPHLPSRHIPPLYPE